MLVRQPNHIHNVLPNPYGNPSRRSGFTLVELSIVIVIIGLLIGGILVAQSLSESASSLRIIRQFQQDSILIAQFKSKFNQLPGDFNRAVETLGATFNGNNDGMILTANEASSVYEHLYKSGLTNIPYNPLLDFFGPPPTKYPSMEINGKLTMYTLTYIGAQGGASLGGSFSSYNAPFYANRFMIGNSTDGAFSPRFAMLMDNKIDDGKPGTGFARSMNVNRTGFTAGCRTHTNPSIYKMSEPDLNKDNVCTFYLALEAMQ